MQSTLVVVLTLRFLVVGDNFAQSPSLGKDIVLEVIATHTTLESEDKYVYLRVFFDGTAEWQSSMLSNSQKTKRLAVKKTLTQDEFMRIKSAVTEPKLAAVGPRYKTRYAIVDSYTEWMIKIQRPGQPQIIQVLEFLRA